jgi:deoxycytidylate deaminase
MTNIIQIKDYIDHPVTIGSNRHDKHINLLSKIASVIEPVAQARVAAALVHHNNIVSFGICRKKSHPFQAQFGKNKDSIFLHAETDCIKNALKVMSLKDVSKCTLYVCRVKFVDETKQKLIFGLAKPCSGCVRAIANFDIKKVVYSLDNEGYNIL